MRERDFALLKKIGTNIRVFRRKKGISVNELAKLSKIRQAYLYKIEKGKAYGLNIDQVHYLAQALNLQTHELIKGE